MTAALFVLQTLASFSFTRPGPGLPDGWSLTRIRHADAPTFSVTRGHTLRVETVAQAGFGSRRMRVPLRPRRGQLTWQWRTGTPLRNASLHSRERDDSPVRVFVIFDDGRMINYSWGNAEPVGDLFLSTSNGAHAVVVCRRAEDANGSWYVESHDPFTDYRHVFNRAPHTIVAVGVGADTDQLHDQSSAEVGELSWE